jgi:regulator of protease activity HflC (stomatin/prohibitin superfamily)
MRTLITTTFAAVAAIATVGCGTTIRPGERGVANRAFAGLQHDVRREGFYFRWPWNGFVRYDVTWQSRSEKVEILSADALHVQTTVTVTYRPRADRLYELATQIGRDYYAEVIRPAFIAIAHSEFAKHTHNALANDGPQIEATVLARLKKVVA